MTLWRKVHQSLAAGATAVQPHHLGIGRGLIDEHQPGRIEQALFAHPTSACPRYVRALLLCRAQTFFERDLVSWKKPPNRRPTARNLVLVHRADDLGSTSISASKKSACFSSGDVLPPRGLAAQRPVSRKHFTQITAVLGLTS
jgi:hypothetical protein